MNWIHSLGLRMKDWFLLLRCLSKAAPHRQKFEPHWTPRSNLLATMNSLAKGECICPWRGNTESRGPQATCDAEKRPQWPAACAHGWGKCFQSKHPKCPPAEAGGSTPQLNEHPAPGQEWTGLLVTQSTICTPIFTPTLLQFAFEESLLLGQMLTRKHSFSQMWDCTLLAELGKTQFQARHQWPKVATKHEKGVIWREPPLCLEWGWKGTGCRQIARLV